MKSSAFGLLAVTFGVFLAVTPLPAHHSFSAEYDSKKAVELKGIVTKVEWMNPHVYFYLDRKSPLWSEFSKAASIGMHFSGDWPELELHLWAILEDRQ